MLFKKLFIYFYCFWLCWVFTTARTSLELRQARATLGCCAGSHCSGFFCGAEPLGPRGTGASARARELRCLGSRAQIQQLRHMDLFSSTARGIFPDQGSNSCLLHWQVDSLPLSHQGSLECIFNEPTGQKFEHIPAVILV